MSIEINNLTAGYESGPHIVENINLTISRGEITILIGPNGCGKSTLLKTIGRLLRPRMGSIVIDHHDIWFQNPKVAARSLSFLAQDPNVPAHLNVEQLVGYGRAPHQSLLGLKSTLDQQRIDEAISTADIEHLRHKTLGELSGGQRQSAFFAMMLAQDTPYLVLDEPTNHLDITHQIAALELLQHLNRYHGKTALLVLHDLNLAARYADRLILMEQGAVIADGTPEHVLSAEQVSKSFNVTAQILKDPVHKKPLCVPYPIASRADQTSGKMPSKVVALSSPAVKGSHDDAH